MPRLLPFLPAALFLTGIAAGRFAFPGGDSTAPASSAAPGAASAKAVKISDEAPPAALVGDADFFAKLARADLAEIAVMWDALPPDASDGSPAAAPWKRMLILERWTELDPPGALAAAKKHPAPLPFLLSSVYRAWAVLDPAAAMEAVKAESGENQSTAALAWLGVWADEPAQLARRAAELKWLNVSALEEQTLRESAPMGLLRKVHAADRDGLLSLSGWMPPWFDGILRELDWHAAWTKGGEAARAALDSLATTNDDIRNLARDLAPLFRTRPEEAMDLLERLLAKGSGADWPKVRGNLWTNSPLVREMVNSMGGKDPDRVAKLLSLTGEHGGGAQANLHFALTEGTLARENPAAALNLAARLTKTSQLGALAGDPPPALEPHTALAAVRDAAPSWLRDHWMERALLGMPADEAAAWIDGLPEGEIRTSAKLTLDIRDMPETERDLRRVISQHPGEALSPADRERVEWTARVPVQGADLPAFSERLATWPEGQARDAALRVLAGRWAHFETSEAIDWAESWTDDSLRAAASAGIAKSWAGADPAAASEWVESLPPGPAREAATGELAVAVTGYDPASGMEWAASLTDPQKRYDRLAEVSLKWAEKDSAAAAAGIGALPGLSAADRTALLNSLPAKP